MLSDKGVNFPCSRKRIVLTTDMKNMRLFNDQLETCKGQLAGLRGENV